MMTKRGTQVVDGGYKDPDNGELDECPNSNKTFKTFISDVDSTIGAVDESRLPNLDAVHLNTFLQRQSKRLARNPCTYLFSSIFLALVLSCVGMIAGGFSLDIEDDDLWSRGTPLSNQQRQETLIRNQRFNLVFNESAWDILTDPSIDQRSYQTNLFSPPFMPEAVLEAGIILDRSDLEQQDAVGTNSGNSMRKMLEQAVEENNERRRLDQQAPETVLAGCDLEFYSNPGLNNLWPIWKIPDNEYQSSDTRTVLDADVLRAICLAEAKTQAHLEEKGLCDTSRGCNTAKCLPPYSIVLYARLIVDGALESTTDGEFLMDCQGLSEAWTPNLQEFVENSWVQDIKYLKISAVLGASSELQYPYGYYPTLVQSDFDTNSGRSQYTSSIFDTNSVDIDELYEEADFFDRAEESDGLILGAYDTGSGDFSTKLGATLLVADVLLAMAGGFVVVVAIISHTQSLLITILGLLQIGLSFPVAFFFNSMVLGIKTFPFINFIAIFLVLCLGAGDIFVAFDKWIHYRKNNKTKSTEYVAAHALPESLSAMFLTTLTTAIAFFASAVCAITTIKIFAIFCGLIIIFDYILTVAFIFPALCIMDQTLIKGLAGKPTDSFFSCWLRCVSCGTCFSCCSKMGLYDDVAWSGKKSKLKIVVAEENYSSTQRLMSRLSHILYRTRWLLLALIIGSFGFFCYYSTKLPLPESSDLRLLKPSVQFEQAYTFRKELLVSDLQTIAGSQTSIVWGLDASDTGKQTDPFDGTSLVLDETFDPSSADAQIFLRDFCGNFFEEDFARIPEDDFLCAINQFDKWLQDESLSDEPDPVYNDICGSPIGIPVASDQFHGCMTAWARKTGNFDVISRDGIVKYMRVPFRNPARFSDTYDVLEEEVVAIDDWLARESEDAPAGVNKAFFASTTFHWYDTVRSIQMTAYSSVSITLSLCATIVLVSSQSISLMIFTTATILYILVSVVSVLVAMGWTLGFLEAICFSVLIGLSVDFVIHLTHAYCHQKSDLAREERTRYALITMGPTIMTTATTTFFSAGVQFFCELSSFSDFGTVLLLTIVFAVFASFVVFTTLSNCFGPSNPGYLVDKYLAKSTKEGDCDGNQNASEDLEVVDLEETYQTVGKS